MRTLCVSTLIGMSLVAGMVCRGAEAPNIVNAKLQTRSASSGLESAFQGIVQSQNPPAWIGYSVPIVPGQRNLCCFDSYDVSDGRSPGCGRCALEEGNSVDARNSGPQRVELESSPSLLVFLRVAEHRVTRILTFSDNCEIDAGGLTVIWLTGVSPSQSVALLDPYVRRGFEVAGVGEDDRGLASSALAAIALTADPSADSTLAKYLETSQPENLRKKVPFWLGSARGRKGFEELRQITENDPSEEVRKSAAFGLSVSREPEALGVMIQMARYDASADVRGQALFWLAHKASQKVAGTITSAIENDPETKVKRQAVFALSQLPKDQGVPLLIHVAQTNRNPEVRRQAMFWLGQSNDPRAMAFIEAVLSPR